MAGFRIIVDTPTLPFLRISKQTAQDMAAAATSAMKQTGQEALTAGRANIAAAGFPTDAFQKAWQLQVYPKRGNSLGVAAFLANKIPFSEVFEDGATVKGDPLMWVPFSTTPKLIGTKRLTPKVYVQEVGPLVTAPFKTSKGRPILAANILASSKDDRSVSLNKLKQGAGRNPIPTTGKGKDSKDRRRLARFKREGAIASVITGIIRLQPLFFGVDTVRIRRRFFLKRTTQQAAGNFSRNFVAFFDALKDR